jgi:ribosomal protein L19E
MSEERKKINVPWIRPSNKTHIVEKQSRDQIARLQADLIVPAKPEYLIGQGRILALERKKISHKTEQRLGPEPVDKIRSADR